MQHHPNDPRNPMIDGVDIDSILRCEVEGYRHDQSKLVQLSYIALLAKDPELTSVWDSEEILNNRVFQELVERMMFLLEDESFSRKEINDHVFNFLWRY